MKQMLRMQMPTTTMYWRAWGRLGAIATAMLMLSARTKIFLYVKILSTFADSQLSLFTTLINKKDMLTGALYSKFKPRNSQLAL